jgi:hypothetical protein
MARTTDNKINGICFKNYTKKIIKKIIKKITFCTKFKPQSINYSKKS